MSRRLLALAGAAGLATSFAVADRAEAAPVLPAGWTCVGLSVCGTFGPDGVVTAPPAHGPNYVFITTAGASGLNNAAITPATGQETNGSRLETNVFSLDAGDKLSFYFNYVTSDGAIYTEYAWAGLFNTAAQTTAILFTARTTPGGDTVPGFGLPGLAPGVTLDPAATPIIAGAPAWAPLGASSSACYGTGCGYTDWIHMTYAVTTPGTFQLVFGVTNALDESYDSGMAIAGVAINDDPITPVPEPMSLALLGLGLAGLAAARRLTAA